ncbi:MAG: hypothetical protein K6G65_00670 [Lachnospiraceae bacterium]|nr:hypothetical protein [Lachnospiraceae bacterium]
MRRVLKKLEKKKTIGCRLLIGGMVSFILVLSNPKQSFNYAYAAVTSETDYFETEGATLSEEQFDEIKAQSDKEDLTPKEENQLDAEMNGDIIGYIYPFIKDNPGSVRLTDGYEVIGAKDKSYIYLNNELYYVYMDPNYYNLKNGNKYLVNKINKEYAKTGGKYRFYYFNGSNKANNWNRVWFVREMAGGIDD